MVEDSPNLTASDVSGVPPGFWLVAGLLSAASVIPIWLCEYFPSQNGPSLLHISYMLKEFNNPDLGFWKFFEKHPFPVPYLLETAGLNFLFLFVGPLFAQKIWISLIVLLRPMAVFYMLRQLGRGREIYGLACLPLLYDYSLYLTRPQTALLRMTGN
jgi:hypothetical protein